ncbi:MAG: 4-alpha-glucanotransferase [Verrucomicrobiota bacterium]
MRFNKECRYIGIFAPVFALRTDQDLGVGDVSGLIEMIEWCGAQRLNILQILPINETSGDNSPYNVISSQALDITTLSFRLGNIPGHRPSDIKALISAEALDDLNTGVVKYSDVKKLKWQLCRKAYKRWKKTREEVEVFDRFCEEQHWLQNYACFRSLMKIYNSSPAWMEWDSTHQTPQDLGEWLNRLNIKNRELFATDCEFYAFVQWCLYRQWDMVRAAAEKHEVGLMGDIPFGVSRSSVDVWAQPDLFSSKWSGGAPPEPLFATDEFTIKWGQNWGVPVYQWDKHREEDFAWWKARIKGVTRFFDLFRLDHVLGFYRIYAFPWPPEENSNFTNQTREEVEVSLGALPQFLPSSDETEEGRRINQAQGEELLSVVLKAAGDAVVVAEDLGMVPEYVRPSLEKLGISGFRIPVFTRQEWDQEYVAPESYPSLTFTTLSTHDHHTMAQMWENWWSVFEQADQFEEGEEKQKCIQASWELYRTLRFAKMNDGELVRKYSPNVHHNMIARLMGSNSWLVVLMVTDLFDWDIRFNVPGPAADSNWSVRVPLSVKELQIEAGVIDCMKLLKKEMIYSNRLHEKSA